MSRASSAVLCRLRFGASGRVRWVSDQSTEAAAVAMPCLSSGGASESNHEARTVAQTPAIKLPAESPSPSIFSCVARTGIAVGQSGACLLVGQRSPPREGPSGTVTDCDSFSVVPQRREPVPRCGGGELVCLLGRAGERHVRCCRESPCSPVH